MKIAGLKVIDAKRPITIRITPSDIARGDTKDPGSCAAARSLVRSVKQCTEARVHLGRTYIKVGSYWVRYITSAPMRGEIIAFDRGAQFVPGTYTLRPSSVSNRLGAGRGSNTNRTKPKHTQKRRRSPHVVQGVRAHGANR